MHTVSCARRLNAARAEHERLFAHLLADHTQAGSTMGELLPVEEVLAEVILPLAKSSRVLLLVLDGVSTGVACELLADLSGRGWVAHTLTPAQPVISVLPSVTRVSRTSLLTGQLTDGTQDVEKAAFAEHGWPLFHKADLSAAGAGDALAPQVARAIRGKAVVAGIVVNTVDDTLDKGGRAPWAAESEIDSSISSWWPGTPTASFFLSVIMAMCTNAGHAWSGTTAVARDGAARRVQPATMRWN